jgi:hypothetical protein
MQLPGKLILVGAVLGLIPLGLGAVALATTKWTFNGNYGLFNTFSVFSGSVLLCGNPPKPQIILALEIGGVAAILVGIILSVLLSMLIKNKWIRLLPQIFLILGPTAILIGLVLLLECLRDPGIGYSMLLMIIACITGYILAIYFAFATVFGRHNHENSSTDIVRESVRF